MQTGEVLQREFDPCVANFKPLDRRFAHLMLFFLLDLPQFPGYVNQKLKALVLDTSDVPV